MRGLDVLRRFINPPPPPTPSSPKRNADIEDRSAAVIAEAAKATDDFWRQMRSADRLFNPSNPTTPRKKPRARAHS